MDTRSPTTDLVSARPTGAGPDTTGPHPTAASGPDTTVDPADSDLPLSDGEAAYVAASRAESTLRGYRADWRDWQAWCDRNGFDPLPASPAAVSRYLADLAETGTRVGTLSRRLSSLRFAHQMADLPSPTDAARVVAVWEGIRRTHGAPPDQAAPLAPPDLFDVVDACPDVKHWRTPGRDQEPSLAGVRDRALLLVGFVGALRRSELVGIRLEDLEEHSHGLVLTLPRSKTNQTGEQTELVAIPRAARAERCPVQTLRRWLELAGITSGPVFRRVTKGNRAGTAGLNPESANVLIQTAVRRAGLDPSPYSAHSLRAGFVTYAHRRGASDRAIAHQTRHRSLATLGQYIRIDETWEDNAATQLGF